MRELTIEPEFRDKIPPLSADEFARLEANILEDGEVREPIVIWGNTIVDGHNRWAIIQMHPEIPYKTKPMNFADKWDAIVWMCRNQLGRRNLTEAQRMNIVAQQYEAQKKTSGAQIGNKNAEKRDLQSEVVVSGRPRGTAGEIARQNGMSTVYVERAVRFSKGLDTAESVSPGIRDAVLLGEVRAPKGVIAEIRNLPDEQKKEVADAIKAGEIETAKEVIRQTREEPLQSALRTAAQPASQDEPVQEECQDEFTIEDLCSLVDSAIDNLDAALDMHLVSTNHLEPLYYEDGRKAVLKCLHRGHGVIEYYMKHIRSMKKNVK